MSNMLSPGANMSIADNGPYRVVVTHNSTGPTVDLTAFVLNGDKRTRSDADMVFYNQPTSDSGTIWVEPTKAGSSDRHALIIDPAKWPADVAGVRIALTAMVGTFGEIKDLEAQVLDSSNAVVASFDLSKRGPENAFIVGEIYRRNGALKARCEAAGFTNGLAGLARDAGINVDDEPATAATPSAQTPTASTKINMVKRLAEAPLPPNASVVDQRKKTLAIILVKNKLDGKTYRVVLAIDASGSMYSLFAERVTRSKGSGFMGRGGTTTTEPSVVQSSLERMVPIADLLDDNHEMEVWYFGSRPSKSDPVTIQTMEGYINRTMHYKEAAGWDNVEPLMMQEIIDWVDNNPSPYPTLALAWSDGGVGNEKKITKLLVSSSSKPIYWMWLGLGRSNYGVLARLDNVKGGMVDNAGFIEIDDIEQMSDADLYKAIFEEVSKWHRDATAAGIIR